MAKLTDEDVAAWLRTRPQWQGDASGIHRTVECESFPAAIDVVRAVAEVAEERDHHPDIDIRWRTLRFALSTHSEGGVTDKDTSLAEVVDRLCARKED